MVCFVICKANFTPFHDFAKPIIASCLNTKSTQSVLFHFPDILTIEKSSARPLSEDGIIWINSSAKTLNNGALITRWQYPCIQNIECKLTYPDSVTMTGQIVLSSLFVFLTILLMISLKVCHWKATQNDIVQVVTGNCLQSSSIFVLSPKVNLKPPSLQRKKTFEKQRSRGNNKVVETVPALGQHCRLNMVDPRERFTHLDTRVDERLQYSYNSRFVEQLQIPA